MDEEKGKEYGSSKMISDIIGELNEEKKFNNCEIRRCLGKEFEECVEKWNKRKKEIIANDYTDEEVLSYRKIMLRKFCAEKYIKYLEYKMRDFTSNLYLINIPLQVKDVEERERYLKELLNGNASYLLLRIFLENNYGHFQGENIYQIAKYWGNEESVLYSFLIEIEGKVFSEGIFEWEKVIENEYTKSRTSFELKMTYLRKGNKEFRIKDVREKYESRLKGKIREKISEVGFVTIKNSKELVERLSSFYAAFLLDYIIESEEIWRIYYANKSLRRECKYWEFKQVRDEIIEKINNPEGLGYVDFFLPKLVEQDIFEYSYDVSFSYRVIKKMLQRMHSIVDIKYKMAEAILPVSAYNDFKGMCVYFFKTAYINGGILDEICKGILEERMKTDIISADKRCVISTEGILCDHVGKEIDYIWGIRGEEIQRRLVLKTHFSPYYQIKKANDFSLNNLMEKGYCKNRTFSNLIDICLDFCQRATPLEQYMLEKSAGIMSAWKLYHSTILLEKIGNNEIKAGVGNLAEEIGKVHSLEMRLEILERVEKLVLTLMKMPEKEIASELKCLSDNIHNFIKEFNILYHNMERILLTVFQDENWEKIEPICDTESETFKILKNYIRDLKSGKSNSVSDKIFEKLYCSDAKKKEYEWFQMIWKGLRKNTKNNP